ncbi:MULTISPECIES: hypothetical protein [Lysinibacillus]|uniref:hypothetical protein n=1 Tax=Lysinibacillus TaxID=400634 RepID=UPI001C8CB95E|nr:MULTISPECIES: hypothetical protein [Lysinibacillus]MBX8943707.1 hypothetical protein [Lysinibacillus sp. K60]UNT57501.1 hypothetical protein ICJ70_10905 [Lysinibacillus capsici]WDU77688.1 hypothetical protein PSR12_13420 [Lysinibacillus sp. G01H]WHP42473.1 hypothetical protein QIX46_05475 [Lysinibacillus boronitolerans]
MTYDFWMMASIMELVEYPDETSDDYIAHPTLQTIMDVLEIQVPIAEIYERYFGQSIHTGHVLVFANKKQPHVCVVLDTYRDPLDQLDLIQFGWRVNTKDVHLVRQLTRKLFDNCEERIRYEEGQSILYQVLQEQHYPRKLYYETLYEQQLKKFWV